MIYTITLNPALDKELTVPSIEQDSVLRARATRADAGGKGFNVSRMLNVLGANSVALGFVGGHTGQRLHKHLAGLGIESDFVWVDGETRTNVSIVSSESEHYIKVNEPGPTITDESQAQLTEKVQSLAREGDWWVLAGSLPPGVSAEFYATLISQIKAVGAHAILDTSGPALRLACATQPYLVKPNGYEAEQLTGETTPERQAHAIRKLGVENVIISLGGDGALVVTEAETQQIAAPSITERNPIGAGDSLVAGVVWGLANGESLPSALRWGVASGAAAAASSGTSMPERSTIVNLLEQVV